MGKAIVSIFTSRWMLASIGVIFLGLLIWFLGPLIAVAGVSPLEGILGRIIAELILLLIALAIFALIAFRHRQVDATLTKEIAASSATQGPNVDGEVKELSDKLTEALTVLKKTRFGGASGKRFLYQLPWYVFIGPPGAGKTTALENSGLNFPLAERFGKGGLKGVGGTRSCDWMFTDNAVLIDTAGRYTTQDSASDADNAAWLGFLRLLKRSRKQQPLNGAIVAIGISDLLMLPQQRRSEHADAIRKRIKELYTELGVRLPVYVLFTKVDLLTGFVEFFDDLKREEREQVWGVTFDYTKSKAEEAIVAAFNGEFDGLLARVDERLLERMNRETDVQRRGVIFGFPAQLASIRETANNFLEEIFRPNRFEESILLRGVYLTSGTQFGTPIDRMMGAMASTFGIQRQPGSAFQGQGRSYFLTNLFRQVIFGEAGLVNADPKVEKRTRLIRLAAYAGCAVVVLAMLGVWTASYLGNSALIAKTESQIADYQAKAQKVELDKVSDPNLLPIVPLLDELRDLPAGYGHKDESVPLLMGFGLYQGDKLGSRATSAYYQSLGGLLLPRMILRLENQISANMNRPEFPLYLALKTYLMMGAQGPLDKNLVASIDWGSDFSPADQAARTSLQGHVAALLTRPLPPIELNADLVGQARQILAKSSWAERALALLKTDSRITALPDWRISDNAGPAAARVFVRKSGQPLTAGISGIYTYKGYYNGFRLALPEITAMIAADRWVLGPFQNEASDSAAADQLRRDVTSLYLQEFGAAWDNMLGDVTLQPITNVPKAVEILNVASAPDSPIRALTVSAAKETTLSTPPPPDLTSAAGIAAAAAKAASGAASAGTQQVKGLLGGSAQQGPTQDDIVGQYTDTHFKALHDLVAGAPGQQPIDGVITNLGDLYQNMLKLSGATDQGGALLGAAGGSGGGAATAIQANASRLPDPVKGWVSSAAGSSASIAVGGARTQLNALWTANVLPFCKDATTDRYPVYPNGSAEVTVADFAKLFGKGGLIDDFYSQNLKSFVDTSKNPWQWQKVNNNSLGISQDVLMQFQRAIAIRDSMFPGGGAQPGFSFQLVPKDLDPGATQVVADIDGQKLTYAHGPLTPMHVQWPNPAGTGNVRISFQPSGAISLDGPWSLLRLFDQGHLMPTDRADRFTVTFTAEGHTGSFEIRADSVVNPFASDQLSRFRCPAAL